MSRPTPAVELNELLGTTLAEKMPDCKLHGLP